MTFLPEELILGILSRVPSKAAMRLRLVCKGWDELISDPSFARIAPISAGFFSVRLSTGGVYRYGQDVDDRHVASYTSFTGDGEGGIPPMAKTLLSEGFVVEASCNGLILFRKESRLLICDPVTQTSVTIDDSTEHLPRPDPDPENAEVYDVQLLYDPKVSLDFKIVKVWLVTHLDDYYVFFHVFSSRDGSWRELSKHAPYEPMECWDYVACSSTGEEGAVCWLEKNYGCLKVYDIGADSIWEIPLPPIKGRKKQRGRIMPMGDLLKSVSGGRVYFIREVKMKLMMWRLDGKEKRWVLEFDGRKTSDPVFSWGIHC